MRLSCPSCSQAVLVEAAPGTTVSCPHCRGQFRVPDLAHRGMAAAPSGPAPGFWARLGRELVETLWAALTTDWVFTTVRELFIAIIFLGLLVGLVVSLAGAVSAKEEAERFLFLFAAIGCANGVLLAFIYNAIRQSTKK